MTFEMEMDDYIDYLDMLIEAKKEERDNYMRFAKWHGVIER